MQRLFLLASEAMAGGQDVKGRAIFTTQDSHFGRSPFLAC